MSEKAQNQEIEITPEMMTVGLEAFWSYDPLGDSSTQVVAEIFQEMWKARNQALPPSSQSGLGHL